MINYLNGTNKNYPTMSDNYLKVIKWYVEAIFAVRSNFKSYTGVIMTMGQGVIQLFSRKHKLNTRIITEA